LGGHFAAAVEEATVQALAFPQAGSPAAANTRRVFIKGFPFSIIYRAEGDGIVVFASPITRGNRATGVSVSNPANPAFHRTRQKAARRPATDARRPHR
jgi:hypothetical protein